MVSHELMGPWERCILQCILTCHGILGISDSEMCTCGILGCGTLGILKFILIMGLWEPWILKCILDVGPWKPRILKYILDMGPWEPRILKRILDTEP